MSIGGGLGGILLLLSDFQQKATVLSSLAATESQGSSEAVSIAGIHATVIALFMAGAVAYVAIVLGSAHAMTNEILERAAAARGRRVNIHVGSDALSGYDGRDQGERDQLARNIFAITHEKDAWLSYGSTEGKTLDETVPPVAEVSKRGEYLIAALSRILCTYPVADETQFAKLPEVRAWLPDALNHLGEVLTSLQLRSGFVGEIVAKYAAGGEEARDKQSALSSDAGLTMMQNVIQATDPRRLLDEFYKHLADARAEAVIIGELLRRHDAYVYRQLSPETMSAAFVLAIVAFVTGVAIPLINTSAARWIYVGVPLGVYAISTIAAGAVLMRWYWKSRRDEA